MGCPAPIESLLDLDDLPRATVHGGIEALAGQTLADTCGKGKGDTWPQMGQCPLVGSGGASGQDCEMLDTVGADSSGVRNKVASMSMGPEPDCPGSGPARPCSGCAAFCRLLGFSVPPLSGAVNTTPHRAVRRIRRIFTCRVGATEVATIVLPV